MPEVTLETTKPSEVRLSPNGNLIYSADTDGHLRVYDASSGSLVHDWQVGQSLGGMDISPDGSSIVVLDRDISAVYRIDTTSGATASYFYSPTGMNGLLFDAAYLSDGTALFSQNFNGSGWVSLKVLDFSTGTFTAGPTVNQSAVLTRSATGDNVLIGEPNNSGGPLDIYHTGQGIVSTGSTGSFNWGIQAFSGTQVAEYGYDSGIHIYNSALQGIVTLTAWNNGAATDLAFSPDGKWLYVLDNKTDAIDKVSTTSWQEVESIPVGSTVGTWDGQLQATNGSRLIVDPQQRYFSVITDHWLVIVDNPDAPTLQGTAGADVITGSMFADTISGGLGNDTLRGGTGNDTFLDTEAGHNGDTITDFHPGDTIIFSDASLSSFSFNLSGNTLTYTGGSMTLDGDVRGELVASSASSGGVQLLDILVQHAALNDFSGSGHSDVLLVNDNGSVTNWLGQSGGTFFSNQAAASYALPSGWSVAGTGDFNSDGHVDLLLRNTNGTITEWLGQANGGFAWNANATYALDNSWHVAAIGDFNGDGQSDVLLVNSNGSLTDWLGQSGGTFFSNHAAASYALPSGWSVVGSGDFNGDGRSDLLLRNTNGTITEWLGQANGGFTWNANATYALDPSWHVAGIGDFNGDGHSDVLLVNDNGSVTDWLGEPDGTFFSNHASASFTLPSGWSVAGTGDYNGDGIDDVLLRNTNGTITEWLGTSNGGFSWNANATYALDNSWHVQPQETLT